MPSNLLLTRRDSVGGDAAKVGGGKPHPVVAELDSYPLAYVQVDGLDEGLVFGDGGLAPQPERGACAEQLLAECGKVGNWPGEADPDRHPGE